MIGFTGGAVIGWTVVSVVHGQLLPALCAPTIAAVFIGGVLGELGFWWSILSSGAFKDSGTRQTGQTTVKAITLGSLDSADEDAIGPSCPRGHGPTIPWRGKMRCGKCGWQPESD